MPVISLLFSLLTIGVGFFLRLFVSTDSMMMVMMIKEQAIVVVDVVVLVEVVGIIIIITNLCRLFIPVQSIHHRSVCFLKFFFLRLFVSTDSMMMVMMIKEQVVVVERIMTKKSKKLPVILMFCGASESELFLLRLSHWQELPQL